MVDDETICLTLGLSLQGYRSLCLAVPFEVDTARRDTTDSLPLLRTHTLDSNVPWHR